MSDGILQMINARDLPFNGPFKVPGKKFASYVNLDATWVPIFCRNRKRKSVAVTIQSGESKPGTDALEK